jgi:hypothetical protein
MSATHRHRKCKIKVKKVCTNIYKNQNEDNKCLFLSEIAARNRAVERRLALGALVVCLVEWSFTPYQFYISIVDTTFMAADFERHFLIVIFYYVAYLVTTPCTLFITSPSFRKLFLNDWFCVK